MHASRPCLTCSSAGPRTFQLCKHPRLRLLIRCSEEKATGHQTNGFAPLTAVYSSAHVTFDTRYSKEKKASSSRSECAPEFKQRPRLEDGATISDLTQPGFSPKWLLSALFRPWPFSRYKRRRKYTTTVCNALAIAKAPQLLKKKSESSRTTTTIKL